MLTTQQLLEIVDTMHPLLDELNLWITSDMVRRLLARMGRGEKFLLTGTDQWQVEVYRSAGGHYEELEQEIQRFTKKSEAEVRAIFEDAGIKSWTFDDSFYAAHGKESVQLLQSESMLKLLSDTYQRTNGEIYNFTRTTARASQQRLISILDTAHFRVMSGAQSYTVAVKDAVDEIVSEQTKVVYPTGHIDTIETAVLRAIRTGTAQACGNMTLQGMIDRDWDLIRVSAHIGARYGNGGENPGNHFWWQGKLYSRTGRTPGYPLFAESTGYGTGEGLCGWNCRHSFGPGDPDHNPYADFDTEENKKAYDLSQKQRNQESVIRRTKTKLIALRQAVDGAEDEGLRAVLDNEYTKTAKLLGWQNLKYQAFCKDNGLKPLMDRIQVARWTRQDAARSIAAARKK